MDSKINRHSNRVKLQMVIAFTCMITAIIFLIVFTFSVRLSSAMKNQTADMIDHMNDQITKNISSYMSSIEENVAIIQNDDEIVGYSLEKPDLNMEVLISERLCKYAILPEYQDFGVVYSNGLALGKVSDELTEAMGEHSFVFLKTNTSKGEAAWSTSILNNHERLYYINPINDDVIAVASVPTSVISDTFGESVFVQGMFSYMVDNSLIIQCTNDGSISAGSYLKTNIYRLADRKGGVIIGDAYVVATNILSNRWYVVTAIPSSEILKVLHSTITYILIISGVMLIIGIGLIFVMSSKFTDTMDRRVTQLDVKAQTDLLTGLINKRSFEEIVNQTLMNPEPGMSYALVFMDVDNFKGVNDRCGHDIGDEVLRSFAHTIGTVFRECDIKGRLGGDEFCVLMKLPQSENVQNIVVVNDACDRFRKALYRKASSARQALPAVTSSMGAALWGGTPEGFEELYHKADTALYASKKNGKDTWSIYGQNNVDESVLEDK